MASFYLVLASFVGGQSRLCHHHHPSTTPYLLRRRLLRHCCCCNRRLYASSAIITAGLPPPSPLPPPLFYSTERWMRSFITSIGSVRFFSRVGGQLKPCSSTLAVSHGQIKSFWLRVRLCWHLLRVAVTSVCITQQQTEYFSP